MSAKIRIETLDGKILHRCRARAQRLVDAGTHRWKDDRTIEELVPQSSSSDPARFLIARLEIRFDYEYPVQPDAEKDPHLLPYTYPLPYEILRHYVTRQALG